MDYLAHFLVWALTIFGVSNSFKLAALLQPFRDFLQFKYVFERDPNGHVLRGEARGIQFFYKLSVCPMCLGFWVGALMSLLVWSPTGSDVFIITRLISDAFLGSITSWLLFVYTANAQFSIK